MPTGTEIIILAFAASNGLRVVAYVPQILQLARDESGAAAVSSCTWMLFLVSNLSTAAYASVVLDEPWMTLVFTTNAVFSAAIVSLILMRRRSWKG
jgi:hypothetical protein